MNAPLYTCQGCGAQLSLAQLQGTDCPYCRAAFPHHARAVEHAALVQKVMADNMAAVGMPVMHGAHLQIAAVHHQVNDAVRRTTQAIGIAVAASIALAVGGVVLSAVLLP